MENNNNDNNWYDQYQQEQQEQQYQQYLDNLDVGDPGYADHNADNLDQDEYIAAKMAEPPDDEYDDEVNLAGQNDDYPKYDEYGDEI